MKNLQLHILFILEDFNPMQQRYFVAVDAESKSSYHVCEIIGNYGESRYILKKIDFTQVLELSQSIPHQNNLHLDDLQNNWDAFVSSLYKKESITITDKQIIHPRKQ